MKTRISNRAGVTVLSSLLFLASGTPARAQNLSFDQVWSAVKGGSPAITALQDEVQASESASARAASHWLPRVYATGKAYVTNDPGANFMGDLEQRQIDTPDFAPTALNNPGTSFLKQGSLGVDLPLFEGGAKAAAARSSELQVSSKKEELVAQTRQQYVRVARDFAAMLAFEEEAKQLRDLQAGVDSLLSHYAIGSKANPVGYSGLLGLKNLKNRVEGLLVQHAALAQAKRDDISAAAPAVSGTWPKGWQPKPGRTKPLLQGIFNEVFSSAGGEAGTPAQVRAMSFGADALTEAKSAERARFLPKVGLFAQGDLTSGNRDTATSFTGGAYLQWNLFDPSNLGTVSEAASKANAARARAEAMDSDLRAQASASRAAMSAALQSLELLDESAQLLEEQTQTARKLFQNGSINALQLVEVLNRRADLLQNRKDAELSLVESAAGVYLAEGSENGST